LPDYITPLVDPADDDPQAIAADAYALMQDRFSGWEGSDADPTVVLIEATAIEHAETRRAARETFDIIARFFGQTVFSFPPIDAIPANGASTWTFTDTDGHLIEAGTQITLQALDGSTRVGFEVIEDVTVPNGNAVTGTGEVLLVAVEPGDDGNGLSTDPEPEELLDVLDAIVIEGTTSGGSDAETELEYLDRFARRQRLASTHLVLPDDFTAFARDWTDDVFGQPVARAAVKDLYNPADGTSNNAGMVTVIPVQVDGTALSAGEKTALKAAMEALLQTGFVVNIADPEYTTVTITFTATVFPGFDTAIVQADAEAAVLDFISPAKWGDPPFGDLRLWLDQSKVRRDDLFGVLHTVRGLNDVTALTINGSSSADLTLTITNAHPVGLPAAAPTSTVAGTVT
jgi:hypothetical protein